MRNLLKTTTMHAVIACTMLMTACTTDLYKPDVTEPEKPGTGTGANGIPDNVDWGTVVAKSLTVNVNDEYDGKYTYKVEIFATNPIMDVTAKPLSGAKTNKDLPCTLRADFPKSLKIFYIRQTNPFGQKSIWTFELKEGDMTCDLKPAEAPSTKAAFSLRAGSISKDYSSATSVDFTIPAGAKKLDGNNKNGGIYKIEKSATFTMGKGSEMDNVKLYVEGTLKLNQNEDIEFDNSEIFVLPGGQIEGNGQTLDLNASFLYNAGVIDIKALNLEKENNLESLLFNTGTVSLTFAELNGAHVHNHCLIEIKGGNGQGQDKNVGLYITEDAAQLYLYAGALITHRIKTDKESAATQIHLWAKAMFNAKKGEFYSQSPFVIHGDQSNIATTDYPLFSVDDIEVTNAWKRIDAYNKVEIYYISINKGGFIWGVPQSQGTPTTDIDKSKCNGETGNTPDPEEPDSGKEVITTTSPYTYMFEDNWPAIGDYDMNDIVMNISLTNYSTATSNGNSTTKIDVKATLMAVGGAKELAAAFQLDNMLASNVKSVSGGFKEEGQDKAVIRLFESAHKAFGRESGKSSMINTYSVTEPVVTFNTTIELNKPLPGNFIASDINLFIVWGGLDNANRYEVHLAGYKGTNKAAKDASYVYRPADKSDPYANMMWALMVESSQFSSYPKEGRSILDVYSGFNDWASQPEGAGKNEAGDWYLTPDKDKAIVVELSNESPK